MLVWEKANMDQLLHPLRSPFNSPAFSKIVDRLHWSTSLSNARWYYLLTVFHRRCYCCKSCSRMRSLFVNFVTNRRAIPHTRKLLKLTWLTDLLTLSNSTSNLVAHTSHIIIEAVHFQPQRETKNCLRNELWNAILLIISWVAVGRILSAGSNLSPLGRDSL